MRVELAGQPVVACRLDVGDVALVFVALHLPPYEEGAAERTLVLRKVVAAVQRAPPSEASGRTSALLLAGDFNIRESEAAQCCTDFSLKDASYDGFSWNPRANAYYAAKPGERRKCHRFDRLLFRGAASACAFLVGQCKQFSDGSSFYL